MGTDGNPYRSPEADGDATLSPVATPIGWPARLTCALLLLTVFVVVALPAFQIRRSTSVYDRTVGAYEALVWLVPFFVVIPALFVSTLRLANASRTSKIVSIVGGTLFLAFVGWGFWVWSNPY